MDKKKFLRDLEELLIFLESEKLLTFEDKVEIFTKNNVDRLKTLCYIASQYIKKKLEENEILEYKANKLKRILASLEKAKNSLSIFICPRDDLAIENQDFEKIVGD